MWNRIFLALDGFESGRAALDFTIDIAVTTRADVLVLHVRELPTSIRIPPNETQAESESLLNEAMLALRLAGVGAEPLHCLLRVEHIARRIVDEAAEGQCDVIVLGSRRLKGLERLVGRGVRDRVIRLSHLPVITAPAPGATSSTAA